MSNKTLITIRIDEKIKKLLEKEADSQRRSLSNYMITTCLNQINMKNEQE